VIAQPTCDDIGKVLGQSPHEGTKVPEGSSVDITIWSTGEGIRVPDVRGLSLRDAEQRLRSVGLVVKKVTRQETEGRPPDTVLTQRPKGDAAIARGCALELVVAIPVPLVSVPSFIGLTEQQVRSQLPSGAAGFFGDFRLGAIAYGARRGAAPGTVIAQDPPAGTQVPKRSATPINLVVVRSGGDAGENPGGGGTGADDSVTVPRVTDRSLNDAVQILRKVGLRPEVPEGDAMGGKAVVYRQSPAAGTRVRKGSVVKLYLPIG
jgi:beta-lactam-binding protein with PASTA domain